MKLLWVALVLAAAAILSLPAEGKRKKKFDGDFEFAEEVSLIRIDFIIGICGEPDRIEEDVEIDSRTGTYLYDDNSVGKLPTGSREIFYPK